MQANGNYLGIHSNPASRSQVSHNCCLLSLSLFITDNTDDEMPSNNTMAKPSSFRAVYKIEDSQEIDVDVYLPQPNNEIAPQTKCPIRNALERPAD